MNLQLIAVLALVLVGLVIARTLSTRDADAASRIDLDDLLLGEDGKLSKAAAVMLGAFLVTTWMMVWLTLREKMTEGYLAIYVAAWITPTVTKLVKGPATTPPAGGVQA